MIGIQKWRKETVNVKMPKAIENLPLSSKPGKMYAVTLLHMLATGVRREEVTWVSEQSWNNSIETVNS